MEVYRDGAQPSVQIVGKSVAGILRTVLTPINAIVAGIDKIKERFAERVEEKLVSVPQEQRLLPPPNVSGPVMLNYSLLGDVDTEQEELRDMYASLLASAIDPATSRKAHPSFASIIQQMTSTEAVLLKRLAQEPKRKWLAVELQRAAEGAEGFVTMGRVYEQPEGIRSDVTSAQLENLARLALIEIRFDTYATQGDYKQYLDAAKTGLPELADTMEMERGVYFLTMFGIAFVKACVRK